MKGTCEQIPFHFFLKFMMLSCGGGGIMIPDETVSKLWNHPERIKESKSLFRKGILSYRTVFDLKSAISMKCKAYTNVIKINENT